MIYHCKHCHFTFKRASDDITVCPDCGKPEVRPALKAEIEEFERYLKQEEPEKKRNATHK